MLADSDIEKIATQELDLPIVGVFSKDLLPTQKREGSYYINMQNSDDGAGTHWVLAKIMKDNDDEYKAIYFDSFGVGMPKEVEEFLSHFKPIPYNNRQIQDLPTTQCGYYCLYCDYYLEHLRKNEDISDDYENFLRLWSGDTKNNLSLLKKLMKPL
jgi:hypothetical protein